MKVVNFDATLEKVRVATQPLEEETPEQFSSHVRHLTALLIEHSPQDAVMRPLQQVILPEQEMKEDEL